MRIEKKIWSVFFEGVSSGKKRFELRMADFECKPGDVLVLREWDPDKKDYTGRVVEKKVTSVMKVDPLKYYKVEDLKKYGMQVIGIE